jgi:hypothetical protein
MRVTRAIGVGVLLGSLVLGLQSTASGADETPTTSAPSDEAANPAGTDSDSLPETTATASAVAPPYGSAYPVKLETNFSRPYKAISSAANSDFSLLNDLERLIRGSYVDPRTGKYRTDATKNHVYMSISRMENSHRVGRELVRAAKRGVTVRVIHGKASQSKESRALASALRNSTYKGRHYGAFKICSKGKSLACLSEANGAIMHSKILLVSSTFTRDKEPALGAIWSGSANLGGPSGERTFNNGLTIYNDQKLWYQMSRMWSDMYAERDVHNNYLGYVATHSSRYGYADALKEGYNQAYAEDGMFYSNLANVTIYATPIYATPTNNRDPVLVLLKRIVPDDQCRIRLQENRFKYRRIAVAHKLVELANKGCTVEVVAFEDDLKVNRVAHCQQYIRVCRPILDVLKTANYVIPAAWAKPHDKTIMVEAKLKRSLLNPHELTIDGKLYSANDSGAVRTKIVQAGSAALTGSNLIVSDEITTETTDPAVYNDYLEHWQAIKNSNEFHAFGY